MCPSSPSSDTIGSPLTGTHRRPSPPGRTYPDGVGHPKPETPETRDTRISGRKKGPTSPLRTGLSSYFYSPEMRGVHPSSGPPDPRPIPHRRRTSPTTNPLDSTLSLPSYSLVVSPSASTDLGGQWGPNRSSENLPPPRAPSVDTGLTQKPADAVSTRPEVNFYLFP